MKKITYSIFILLAIFTIQACKKSFIDVKPEGQFLSENYYANKDQAFAGLVSVYDVMRKNSGGFENMITMMNAGSDDHYAGGGGASDGAGIQAFSNYTLNSNNIPSSFWSDHYQGIARANVLLQKLPAVPMDDASKARFTAEAKALRALYYFNLVKLFKNVPLILEPLTVSNAYAVTQATPTAVYAQIEKDLTEAYPILPNTVPLTTETGRLTKGAAQALLGKVYLYDNKNALAAAQFADVNGTPGGTSMFGYKLLTSFSDLWVVANKFNSESVLETTHTAASQSDFGNWGSGRDEGNIVNQMVGIRSYSRPAGSTAPDLPSGWSFNTITQNLYDAIKLDPRFNATVFDMKALKTAGQADYIAGYDNTGYFLNKFMPRAADVRVGGGASETNFRQNTYVIRLADTYLLEAEALGGAGTRAQALLDAVRARVGLASIPVSLASIKQERRMELAGEGHRFFDLVRWGDAAAKLGAKVQIGSPSTGFQAGKNEIFPIPYQELQGTLLKQNPNYN
jgi:starch-binding outer membrane protein, SusD/RagB family